MHLGSVITITLGFRFSVQTPVAAKFLSTEVIVHNSYDSCGAAEKTRNFMPAGTHMGHLLLMKLPIPVNFMEPQ